MTNTLHMHTYLVGSAAAEGQINGAVSAISLAYTNLSLGGLTVVTHRLAGAQFGVPANGLINILSRHHDTFTNGDVTPPHESLTDGMHQPLVSQRTCRHHHDAAGVFV